ncbi:MAG: SRPBCC family protein [Anaerolineae bacterium]|nr:SRPBCC family protein [Anaerolineae bacterium]
MPMKSFETSVIINAPQETVYSYVADFPRHMEWNHSPKRMVALQDGPVQVGSKFQTDEDGPSNAPAMQKIMFAVAQPVMKLLFGAADYTVAEITALEPNQRVAWKAHLPSTRKGDLMRMKWEIRLQDQNGATEVTQACEMAPPDTSPLKGMVNDDLAKQNQAETAANLQRLKSILESQNG